MRIPVKYSRHRFDLKASRVSIIRIDLRNGRIPQNHIFTSHKVLFRRSPNDATSLKRWIEYLQRFHPET